MHPKHSAFAAASVLLTILAVATPSFAAEGNSKPCLCQPSIEPMEGRTKTTFVATVQYHDPDGDAAAKVEVYIDGVAYPMRLVRGRAENGTYRARLTLPEGEHSYYFYAEDGRGMSERFPRYGAKHGPYVGSRRKLYNRPAMLTDGGVYFDYGTDRSFYTFTVHYRDRDKCKPPTYVRVIVDGIPHNMTLHKGAASDGIYLYQASLAAGPHAYYFVAADGDGDCITHPQHGYLRGPEVALSFNSSPRLEDPRVDPPIGGRGTRYSYTVTYRDVDLDPPSLALVYVNDIPYGMRQASRLPYEGTYVYRAGHHLSGSHRYYFYFEDGRGGVRRLPTTGSFHGPVVVQ